MTEPVQLRPAQTEPAPGLVELVEGLLEQVRAGQVRELAYAARRTGGEVATALGGEGDDVFRMLGAVRYLEHRILGGIETP